MNRNLYAGCPSVVGRRVELDLRRQVGPGVLLLPRGQRRELGVAEVELGVGVVDAARDRLAVVGAGEHALRLLAHHDRGAGVLAHRQHAAGGDVDVLEQVERDEPVVARRLGVVDDPAQLRQVRGPQVVGDVVHRLGGQPLDRLGCDLEERAALPVDNASKVETPSVVSSRYGVVVGPDGQQVGVAELGVRSRGRSIAQRLRWPHGGRAPTAGRWDDPTRLRISDSERHQVAELLREAAGEGRLDLDELDQRLEATYAARTYADLVPITLDLPSHPHQRPVPARPPTMPPAGRRRPWCPVPTRRATSPSSAG